MRKFAVFSGFLGSGKTTTMMALTRYYTAHHGKAAMISNDLGEGVTLADDRLARLSGVNASQITDECICFCHDRLLETVEARFSEGKTLVVSDIPGFGVGALEHVYHGLSAEMPGRWALGPFTVLIEPRSVDALRAGLSYLSEDRQGTALLVDETIRANATLSSLRAYCAGPFVSDKRTDGAARRAIADALSDQISKSAVYRNLSAMEAEGKVRRIVSGSSREIFYQYADAHACEGCLHLSCTKCGKTMHMQKQIADRLVDSVALSDKFSINKGETVIYGVCAECGKA